MRPAWIVPDWPAPPGVRALSTTRAGGFSRGPWRGLNLSTRCGDGPADVTRNRALLRQFLPAEPAWLNQVHGAGVVADSGAAAPAEATADARVSSRAREVCVVLAADCLPVLFCSCDGRRVGAAHAGWRGLASGVLEATVAAMACAPGELLAWLGPAIGGSAYEVGEEVRAAFAGLGAAADRAFTPIGARWRFDLAVMARHRLAEAGVTRVSGGGFCTFSDAERFFSHRRDGVTGRMASMVWREDDEA